MLRRTEPRDHQRLAEIVLKVGDGGADATDLFEDPTLLGDIYAVPYAVLLPEWSWVAEDGDGVAGFVAAAPDTSAFEAMREARWFPGVRARTPRPDGDPSPHEGLEAVCQRCVHVPVATPTEIARAYPAHMHLNIDPRAHGRGLGRALCAAVLDKTRVVGLQGIHVGVSPKNLGGLAFWKRMESAPIHTHSDDGVVWLGQRL